MRFSFAPSTVADVRILKYVQRPYCRPDAYLPTGVNNGNTAGLPKMKWPVGSLSVFLAKKRPSDAGLFDISGLLDLGFVTTATDIQHNSSSDGRANPASSFSVRKVLPRVIPFP